MADTCRSCGAPIKWAWTQKDRRIPLDPEPVDGGNVTLTEPPPGHPGKARAYMVRPEPGVERHVSHFATCPNSASHRRR